MRIIAFTAAVAALCIAAPAAAQPNADAILRAAADRMAADLTEVENYAFTLEHAGVRTPVYVHRLGQAWQVRMPETQLKDLLGMAVFWPSLMDPVTGAFMGEAEYLRQERLDGRPVHVLSGAMGAEAVVEVDSALLFVDAETEQIVRVVSATGLPEGDGSEMFGAGAKMIITLDAGGHRETAGLLLPGQVRVRMRLEGPGLSAEVRRLILDQVAAARGELEGSSDPEHLTTLAVINNYAQLFSPDGMDARVSVEDVVVNPGPPDWLDDLEN
jgi:hypothetical protein